MGYPYIVFADKSSWDFGLILATLGEDSFESVSGADNEWITGEVAWEPCKIVYGVRQNGTVSFSLTLVSEDVIPFTALCEIQQWLFNHDKPQKLRIIDGDRNDYYYLCVLKHDVILRDARGRCGIRFEVESISPYAYKDPVTLSYTLGSQKDFTVDIDTCELYGVRPTIELKQSTAPSADTHIYLKNTTTGCMMDISQVAGTSMAVDCAKGVITGAGNEAIVSLTAPASDPDMVMGFLTLANGRNELSASSNTSQVKITYTPAKMIGGI